MKMKLFLTATFLILFGQVYSQEVKTTECIEIKGSDTTLTYSEINIRSLNSSDFVIQIGGHDITFGQKGKNQHYSYSCKDKRYRKASNNYLTLGTNIELGFNSLVNTSYSNYPSQYNGFLDLRGGKSIHFGIDLATIYMHLNQSNSLYLGLGMRIDCDNYTFSDNITIKKIGGTIMPIELDKDYKKSKLTATYFGIPLYLRCNISRGLRLTLNGYADILLNSHTKYKKPKHKENISCLNPVQFGFGGALSYHHLGLYIKYSASPLFKNEYGPKAHLLSAGFAIGF